jgi:hypothetical protein
MDPAAATAFQSSGRIAIDAGKYPDDGPEGAKARSFLPSEIPPAFS